jgi:regulatory protein
MKEKSDPDENFKDEARKRKIPRKATKSHLENAARHYLGRFATSSQNLKNVLLRRVTRSTQHHDTDPDEGAVWIDEIVDHFLDSGLLDDRLYATSRVHSLHARGNSRKVIRMKLRAKGVEMDLIDDALYAIGYEENGDVDLIAGLRLAKRRRLGPYRNPSQREEHREKDMAALARAGFSYHIARQIIETEDPETLYSDHRFS